MEEQFPKITFTHCLFAKLSSWEAIQGLKLRTLTISELNGHIAICIFHDGAAIMAPLILTTEWRHNAVVPV